MKLQGWASRSLNINEKKLLVFLEGQGSERKQKEEQGPKETHGFGTLYRTEGWCLFFQRARVLSKLAKGRTRPQAFCGFSKNLNKSLTFANDYKSLVILMSPIGLIRY